VKTRELASQDPLTGIANRRGLEAALDSLTYSAEAVKHTLILIDLDGFKAINDTYGHTTGDRLLQTVAQVLREQIRAIDLAARLGGDEFALLMVGCPPQEAWIKLKPCGSAFSKFGCPSHCPPPPTQWCLPALA
jgi:diguanylate cyclase (GGDEF)-like protein